MQPPSVIRKKSSSRVMEFVEERDVIYVATFTFKTLGKGHDTLAPWISYCSLITRIGSNICVLISN